MHGKQVLTCMLMDRKASVEQCLRIVIEIFSSKILSSQRLLQDSGGLLVFIKSKEMS